MELVIELPQQLLGLVHLQIQLLEVLDSPELRLQEPIDVDVGPLMARRLEEPEKVSLLVRLLLKVKRSPPSPLPEEVADVEALDLGALLVLDFVLLRFKFTNRRITTLAFELFADHRSPLYKVHFLLTVILQGRVLLVGGRGRRPAGLARNDQCLLMGTYLLPSLILASLASRRRFIDKFILFEDQRFMLEGSHTGHCHAVVVEGHQRPCELRQSFLLNCIAV